MSRWNKSLVTALVLLLVQTLSAADPKPKTDQLGDPLPEGAIARLGSSRLRHAPTVMFLSYSADGKVIASGGQDGAVRVWDMTNGKSLAVLGADPKAGIPTTFRYLQSVSLSPDGKTVAASSSDGIIRAWDIAANKQLFELKPGLVAFSLHHAPDGKSLVLGLSNGQIQLVEADTGKEVRKWQGHNNSQVTSVAFSPDGKQLASLGRDFQLRLWDPDKGDAVRAIGLQQGGSLSPNIVWSPDSKIIATSQYNNQAKVSVWDAGTGKELNIFNTPNYETRGLAFDPQSKLLYVTSLYDPKIRVWDLAKNQTLREVDRPAGVVYSLALSPNGKTLVTGSDQGALLVYDAEKLERKDRQEGHEGRISFLQFTEGGQTLVSAAGDNSIRSWKANGESVTVKESKERLLNLSADGQKALFLATDGTLKITEWATGKEHLSFRPPEGGTVTLAALTKDNRLLTSRGGDDILKTWDASTGKEISSQKMGGTGLRVFTMLPDGRTLIAVSYDGTIRFWDLASATMLRQTSEPAGTVMTVRLSNDGKLLIVGSAEGRVRVFETRTGQKVADVASPSGQIAWSAMILPDGRTLAVSQWNGVRLWDLATEKERGVIVGHQGEVVRMMVSPDGQTLATGGADTTVLLWDLNKVLPPAPETAELKPAEIDELWADLGGNDAVRGYKALWKLIAVPKQTLAYLDDKMKPVAEPDTKRLAKLLVDLESEDPAVRQPALKELEQFGSLATSAIKKALESAKDVDVQLRLRVLLAKQNTDSPTGERLRLGRAVQMLELIGGTEARKVLDKVGSGAEGSELTVDAKAASARLAKRLDEK
jgi:WD40 repeat protein